MKPSVGVTQKYRTVMRPDTGLCPPAHCAIKFIFMASALCCYPNFESESTSCRSSAVSGEDLVREAALVFVKLLVVDIGIELKEK